MRLVDVQAVTSMDVHQPLDQSTGPLGEWLRRSMIVCDDTALGIINATVWDDEVDTDVCELVLSVEISHRTESVGVWPR
ncbi:hypothetical protein [Ornithinimicrobium murale]|uniref:hypothetical protein n=1 Tax=Ornithinimicrobium murale TaxID=1050153 RepID=UPI0013B3EC88|nr:hypothetical protein [Ornithinimicrobium murale]